jgi:hypothetical protein
MNPLDPLDSQFFGYAPANPPLTPRKRLAIGIALAMMLVSTSILLLNQHPGRQMVLPRAATPATLPVTAGHH